MNKIRHLIIISIIIISGIDILYSRENSISTKKTDIENTNNENEKDDLLEDKGATFNIKGQYKNLFTFMTTDDFVYKTSTYPFYETKRKNLATDLKRIRLSPEFKYSDILLIHIDYDNELILSSFNKSIMFDNYWRISGYNDLLDLSWEPHYGEDILYRTKIHRAFIKLVVSDFTVTMGRQLVRFGSGKLWNPLDILNPISPTFIEGAEEQMGTDALKVDYYINETTELTFVYDQKKHNNRFSDTRAKDTNFIARLKGTVFKTDIAVLGGYVSRRGIAGIDTTVTVFDGLLRGCVMYIHPEDGKLFFQANAGYEYTFKIGIYLLVEYLYNGNSINSNTDLKTAFEYSMLQGISQASYSQMANQLITYNEHYMGIALGYDFMPLLRGDIFFMVDFQGAGFFISPSLKYNMMENLDLMIGMMFGHAFDIKDRPSDFEEFEKNYMYYASLSFYF